MGITTLSYSRHFELIHLTNKKHTLSNVDYFLAEDKFRKTTEVSSSLGTFIYSLHYCCHKLNWQTSRLAIKQQR